MTAPAFVRPDAAALVYTGANLNPGTGDYTLSCFFYDLGGVGTHTIFEAGVQGLNDDFFWILGSAGAIAVQFNDSSGAYALGAGPSFTTNAWHSLIIAFDRDGDCTAYLDGVATSLGSIVGKSGSITPNHFALGNYWLISAANSFRGYLSHARAWSRLLTPAEIARQANISSGVPYARPYGKLNAAEKVGLISAWELTDGPYSAAQQALDSHGSNHLSFTASPIIAPGVLNGGFETAGLGGTDVFGSWTEFKAGTSTVNAEATTVYAGSQACRLDVDGSNSQVGVYQQVMSLGGLYNYSLFARSGSGAPTLDLFNGNTHTLSAAYTQYNGSIRASGSGFYLMRRNAASDSIYLDNVTLTAAEIITANGPGVIAGNRRRRLLLAA